MTTKNKNKMRSRKLVKNLMEGVFLCVSMTVLSISPRIRSGREIARRKSVTMHLRMSQIVESDKVDRIHSE